MPERGAVDIWISERLELGEGLRWWGDRLIGVDLLKGRLLGTDLRGARAWHTLFDSDFPLGAVAPVQGEPGTWVAAMGDGFAMLAPGAFPLWIAKPLEPFAGARRMNDAAADASGRFWAGSMAFDGAKGQGALFRMDPDGHVEQVLDGLTIPNGPAFAPDGTRMFLSDSAAGLIYSATIDPLSGDLGPLRLFASPGSSPDGMTVDSKGYLWVALWGAGAIARYSPDGSLEGRVDLPAAQPTSLCLAEGFLWVMTAHYGIEEPGPYDGALLRISTSSEAPPAASVGGLHLTRARIK